MAWFAPSEIEFRPEEQEGCGQGIQEQAPSVHGHRRPEVRGNASSGRARRCWCSAAPGRRRRGAPRGVRDDGKLGGLGLHAALGRSNRTALGSPSPPLLHEVKLSGPVAGGPVVCRLRQEGKLALQHEVKLYGPAAGGPAVCRLRQEDKLALPHEVKLLGVGSGGAAVGRLRQEGNLALLHEVKLWGMCGGFLWLALAGTPSLIKTQRHGWEPSPSRGALRPPSSSSPVKTQMRHLYEEDSQLREGWKKWYFCMEVLPLVCSPGVFSLKISKNENGHAPPPLWTRPVKRPQRTPPRQKKSFGQKSGRVHPPPPPETPKDHTGNQLG